MILARFPRSLLALPALAALPALGSAQAAFSTGTLAVVTAGDYGTVSSSGTQAGLRSYTKGGAPLTSAYALPVFLSQDVKEGSLLCDGTDPFKMSLAGYASAGTNVAGNTTVRRRVSQFDARTASSTYGDLAQDLYEGVGISSAQIIGSRLVVGGAYTAGPAPYNDSGMRTGTYAPGAATPSTIYRFGDSGTYDQPARQVQQWGGVLYQSYGNTIRTYAIGIPTISLGNAAVPTDIAIAGDTMYIANAATDGFGGLYRATRVNGVWGTATQVGNAPSLAHLCFDGTTLFATTNTGGTSSLNNDLLSIDPITGDYRVLASAGTGRSFRGLQAVPEPATLAILGVGALGVLRRRRR